jgi:hypothetical protein
MEYKPEQFPVPLTLKFRSVQEKDIFLAGLIDGWGEGAPVSLSWDKSASVYEVDTLLADVYEQEE